MFSVKVKNPLTTLLFYMIIVADFTRGAYQNEATYFI
ncbi:hypothetical protein RUMGNA_01584 [Mediterraneibacter gnavus ATCC 29149]|uniref:Uncharacterized protein n=1 Tax=Mediterraneibacter gnavus (strain ATCC 29149 / DSM 114966 / JCM 6515 / VPI C7-9) TaxID=411470 RepID=A7B208_MEDG7|nr:hypothetical protein RUMGNA_01584 [Mediterraneibacter gnavus ATCC 29149]